MSQGFIVGLFTVLSPSDKVYLNKDREFCSNLTLKKYKAKVKNFCRFQLGYTLYTSLKFTCLRNLILQSLR